MLVDDPITKKVSHKGFIYTRKLSVYWTARTGLIDCVLFFLKFDLYNNKKTYVILWHSS